MIAAIVTPIALATFQQTARGALGRPSARSLWDTGRLEIHARAKKPTVCSCFGVRIAFIRQRAAPFV